MIMNWSTRQKIFYWYLILAEIYWTCDLYVYTFVNYIFQLIQMDHYVGRIWHLLRPNMLTKACIVNGDCQVDT